MFNSDIFNFIKKISIFFYREDDYSSIKELFPKAEFVVIPGAGHWVHSERPSEFITTLCNFL